MTAPTDDTKSETPANADTMAIDNPAGIPRPEYDQYAVNDPQSLDKDKDDEADHAVRRAADDV